jgi:hypothetical protein
MRRARAYNASGGAKQAAYVAPSTSVDQTLRSTGNVPVIFGAASLGCCIDVVAVCFDQPRGAVVPIATGLPRRQCSAWQKNTFNY